MGEGLKTIYQLCSSLIFPTCWEFQIEQIIFKWAPNAFDWRYKAINKKIKIKWQSSVKGNNRFPPERLMIKESWNPIVLEVHLDTQNTRCLDATFSWDCLHAKNVRYQLIPSRHVDSHRILQFDLVRSTSDHTQPKMVVSDAKSSCEGTFTWWLFTCNKPKISIIDSFQRYWWSQNPTNLIGQEAQLAIHNQKQ